MDILVRMLWLTDLGHFVVREFGRGLEGLLVPGHARLVHRGLGESLQDQP